MGSNVGKEAPEHQKSARDGLRERWEDFWVGAASLGLSVLEAALRGACAVLFYYVHGFTTAHIRDAFKLMPPVAKVGEDVFALGSLLVLVRLTYETVAAFWPRLKRLGW
jgi:hypothetical protein